MMDILDKFLKKYSYKFPKGYPDLNDEQDINLLAELLDNMGVKLEEKQQLSIFPDLPTSSITKDISDGEVSKLNTFKELAKITYKNYSNTLGSVKTVFPEFETKIEDWRKYIKSEEKISNIGREVENALVNYAKDKGIKDASQPNMSVSDIKINDKLVEVKSAGGNIINTKLQTKFYQKDQLYAFVINTKSKDITVYIISGELLYETSLGKDLMSSLESEDKEKFISEIENGLKNLNFKDIILKAFIEKKDLNTPVLDKSFKIGNQIRIRFTLNIESHSGQDKKSTKSSNEKEPDLFSSTEN